MKEEIGGMTNVISNITTTKGLPRITTKMTAGVMRKGVNRRLAKLTTKVAAFVMVCLSVAIWSIPSTASEKSDEALVEKFNSIISSDPQTYRGSAYAFYDINRDGKNEMFMDYETGTRIGYNVFVYRNGKVKKLKSFEGTSGILGKPTEGKIIVQLSGGFDTGAYEDYILKSGKLKKIGHYEFLSASDPSRAEYSINGQQVTQSEYQAVEDALLSGANYIEIVH